jgi:hypothetical protein
VRLLDDLAQGGRLGGPGRQVGPDQPIEVGRAVRGGGEGLEHPEQPLAHLALLGQGEAAVQPRVGEPALRFPAGGDGPVALGVGFALGAQHVPPLALRLPPLPGHPGAAQDQRQQQRRRQHGQGRVAPAPAPEPLGLADGAGADRLVVGEAAQVLGQLGRRLVAVGRVTGQRLEHDRLQVARHRRVQPSRRRRLRVDDLVHQLLPVRLVEGRAQGQQLVKGQPQGVDVAAGVALAGEPLRRHVAQGADDVARVRQVVAVGGLGEAEVGDPDDALGVQEQVARLDVAVQHPLPVRVRQRLRHLDPQPRHAPPVRLPLRRGQGDRVTG